MKPLKQSVSLTLDVDIVKKIKVLAERDDRSLSSYINLVLRDYLDGREKDVK